MVGRYHGLALVKDFLALEEKMRAMTPPQDIKLLQSLDTIRTQLLNIEVSFLMGLQQNTAPTATKTGMLKVTAGGVFGEGFAMLIFLLSRKALRG